MTEQTKWRACNALMEQSNFRNVFVVGTKIFFTKVAAIAWQREVARSYPIETITKNEASEFFYENINKYKKD